MISSGISEVESASVQSEKTYLKNLIMMMKIIITSNRKKLFSY